MPQGERNGDSLNTLFNKMLGKILRYVLDYYWDTMKWDFDNIKMWGIHNVQFNFPLDMRC